jgi:hypothetical protein
MSITVPFAHDQGDLHVPFMNIHAQLDENEFGKFTVTTPAVAAANTFQSAVATAAAAITLYDPPLEISADHGRTVSLTSVTGGTITVYGTNYLAERITQTMTLVGATAQETLKAFKTVDKIVNGTANGNLSVGLGTSYAVPFVLQEVVKYFVDTAGAITTGAANTFTAADVTDPATAATGDPRGLFKPAAGVVANGVRTWEIYCKFNSRDFVNGLHGVPSV